MNDPTTLVLSRENHQFWVIDHEDGSLEMIGTDGRRVRETLVAGTLPHYSMLSKTIFDWEKWWITTLTRREDLAFWGGFNASRPEPEPTRPSVYLDQNMWSRLATAMVAPQRISDPDERWGAEQIGRLASDDGIVLPLSSAHLLETSYLHTERRYEIGMVIAALAGGWQLRHPMDVLEHEAIQAIGTRLGRSQEFSIHRPIVTAEPRAWIQRPEDLGLGRPPGYTFTDFLNMIAAPGEVIQQLIDPEPLERRMPHKWVTSQERAVAQISDARLPKEKRRNLSRRRFWNDNIGLFRKAALLAFKEEDFPTFSDSELRAFLSRYPMTRFLSEIFVQRYMDSYARWKPNDLIDVMYLSCAAGYTDYMAAERRTGAQIAQIQRATGHRITAHSTLKSLATQLIADGVKTDTERKTHPPSGS